MRRARHLAAIIPLFGAAACSTTLASPANGPQWDSGLARVHARLLVTDLINTVQIGPPKKTYTKQGVCTVGGLDPHETSDITVSYVAVARASTAAEIPMVIQRITAYWQQRGGMAVGPVSSGPSGKPATQWIVVASEPTTNFSVSVTAYAADDQVDNNLVVEADSGCVVPVGTDDPGNPTWPPYTGPLS